METAAEHKIKTLSYKIADIDGKQRLVKFYYGAFDNVDRDGEILRKGATLKSIKENGPGGKEIIRHFLNHEFRKSDSVLPLGKITEMGEDMFGPWAVSKIARTQSGNDVYAMYEDNMINNHSMGFMPIKQRGNEIFEIKLFEVSTITTWASNEFTPTISVKEAGNLATSQNQSLQFIKPSTMTLEQEADMSAFMAEFLKSQLLTNLKF